MANPTPWINPDNLAQICADLPMMYKNGESVVEVCVALGTSRQTYYASLKKYPELAEAHQMGMEYSEAWWNRLGRVGAAGKTAIQPTVYIANMNNRFKWGENMRLEHSGSLKQVGYTPEQYAEAQSKIEGKFDDLD